MRLLLVEDDVTLGDAVRAYLRSQGHVVDWLTDIKGARAAAAERFDAILLDWRLPDGSGVDWLRELRAGTEHRQTPILMLPRGTACPIASKVWTQAPTITWSSRFSWRSSQPGSEPLRGVSPARPVRPWITAGSVSTRQRAV